MSCVTLAYSRLSAATLSMSYWPSSVSFIARLWRDLFEDFRSSYRPELHYMRGPGPRWREKHGAVSARDDGIQVSVQERRTVLRTNAPDHERRAIAWRMSPETETLAAVGRERGHTQARETFDA